MIRLFSRFSLIAIAVLNLVGTVSFAEAAPGISIEAVGFAGKYRAGFWTPVRVKVTGPAKGELSVIAGDGDGTNVLVDHPVQVDVEDGNEATFTTYFKPNRPQSSLTIRVANDDSVVAEQIFYDLPKGLLSSNNLVLSIGADLQADKALRVSARGAIQAVSATFVDDAKLLPDRWYGYEAVDLITLTTSDLSIVKELTEDQVSALVQYIRQGGRLLWCVGKSAEALVEVRPRLAELLPGAIKRTTTNWKTSGLEDFVSSKEPVKNVEAAGAVLCEIDVNRGVVDVRDDLTASDSYPVVIRYGEGLGVVCLLTVDLDDQPLSEWRAMPSLVGRVVRGIAGIGQEVEADQDAGVTHVGYDDISGQLRMALDQFENVALTSFSTIILFIIVYVCLIGPADYFILKHFDRLHWSWITFPIYVVLAIAYLTWSLSGSQSPRVAVNQVNIVDIDVRTNTARSATIGHIYSPKTDYYDVEAAAAGQFNWTHLPTWNGLSGTGLGGIDVVQPPIVYFEQHYRSVPSSSKGTDSVKLFEGIPVQHAATRSLQVRSWSTASLSESKDELIVDPVLEVLRGRVSNRLSVPLNRCAVVFENWSYELGDLQPGQTVVIDDLRPKSFKWQLTGRTMKQNKRSATTQGWRVTNTDIPEIVQMMQFHESAGGRSFSSLFHRYQSYLDMSRVIQVRQAVLVGRTEKPFVGIDTAGKDAEQKRWTFVRMVLPTKMGK